MILYIKLRLHLLGRVLDLALSFKDKSIAITGASGTMGRALATELSKQGARIIALTTSPNPNFQIADSDNPFLMQTDTMFVKKPYTCLPQLDNPCLYFPTNVTTLPYISMI